MATTTLRDRTLETVLRTITQRLRKLESPSSIHLGGAGNGFTISVDVNGNLVATSDSGNSTTIALQ